MTSEGSNHRDGQAHYFFIPVLLTAFSLLIMTGFQSYMIVMERSAIRNEHARQSPVIEQATKMRAQLDSIAKRTAQLADAGNPNARGFVEQLRKAGVTIQPNGPDKK